MRRFPFDPVFWCYLEVEVDETQEGLPINIRYEIAPDGDGASGPVQVLSEVDRIGPMRADGDRVARFRDHMEVQAHIPTVGHYEVRAYVDDILVATRDLLARNRQ